LLQNLSDVLNREQKISSSGETQTVSCSNVAQAAKDNLGLKSHRQKSRLAELNAQREWRSAITSVGELLLAEIDYNQDTTSSEKLGLIFFSPVPLLSNPDLCSKFQSAVFTTDAFKVNALMPCRSQSTDVEPVVKKNTSALIKLPLIPQDPIAQEQFCLVLTANFGLIIILGQDSQGNAKFHFSFAPATLSEVWETLRSRLVITNYSHLDHLDSLVSQYTPPNPDYHLVTKFSRLLLQNLPNSSPLRSVSRQVETIATTSEQLKSSFSNKGAASHVEMELLQALTHEVRTPLTTIRTLTKLLLKRKQDLKANVVQRLQTIDRECTEQIERMELIFRAAELESTPPTAKPVELVPFSLEQVFHQSIPRWQEKAKRRNVDLEFTLPSSLPKIISDPGMLDTVLTGVMESCTRSLPTGGHVDVIVSTAGNQLKLQVISQAIASDNDNPFKSLGQLLTFQPATGCLSLNLDATKNIFQALGGKLTVRQRQEQGKELTIFLPLGNSYNTSKA